MILQSLRRWSLLSMLALTHAASDDVLFFFTNTYGECGYGSARMQIAGGGLCAYDSTINRVYMCDKEYAAAIGDACYALGQTCEAGVNAPGDEQILCQALGLDTNQEWCCSTAELCVTGQGQYSVCGTKFLRPNYTAEQEYEALGVESVPATLTKGQAIGTGSQVVISSTMVQTGGPSSISALPPDNTSGKPPRSTNEAGLGGGAYAGIAIGAVAVLLLIAGCVWFFLKRRAKKETTPTPATEPRLPQEDFGPVEVEAKYFGASEAPANTYHELSARDKPIEAPGAHQRHELGRSIS